MTVELSAASLVAKMAVGTEHGVAWVVYEAASRGVECTFFHLSAHVGRRGEFKPSCWWHCLYLVATSVSVVILPFGNIDEGEGPKALNGYALAAFGELKTHFVEYGWQYLLDGGAANAASPDDGGDEVFPIIVRSCFSFS